MKITQTFISILSFVVSVAAFSSQTYASALHDFDDRGDLRQFRIAPDMEYFGRTKLGNIFSDSDVINFGACGTRENSPVHAVQLEVSRAEVEIQEIVLQFGNGEEQRLSVRSFFRPGTSSRVIDLEGNFRCVQRAFITGRTLSFGPEGVVALYGLRRVMPEPNPGNGNRFQRFLGATYLEFRGDSDVIQLGRCGHNPRDYGPDRASALVFRVTRNNAEIDHIVVQFGNGQSQEIQVRNFFEENSWSVRKDLDGGRRCVDKIYVYGRTVDTRGGGMGESRFEVYGLD